jgi:hypothetical protein
MCNAATSASTSEDAGAYHPDGANLILSYNHAKRGMTFRCQAGLKELSRGRLLKELAEYSSSEMGPASMFKKGTPVRLAQADSGKGREPSSALGLRLAAQNLLER